MCIFAEYLVSNHHYYGKTQTYIYLSSGTPFVVHAHVAIVS